MAAVTRLGLYGGPRSPYGSFAGKTPDAGVIYDRRLIVIRAEDRTIAMRNEDRTIVVRR